MLCAHAGHATTAPAPASAAGTGGVRELAAERARRCRRGLGGRRLPRAAVHGLRPPGRASSRSRGLWAGARRPAGLRPPRLELALCPSVPRAHRRCSSARPWPPIGAGLDPSRADRGRRRLGAGGRRHRRWWPGSRGWGSSPTCCRSPVLVGYMTGVAVAMIVSQLPEPHRHLVLAARHRWPRAVDIIEGIGDLAARAAPCRVRRRRGAARAAAVRAASRDRCSSCSAATVRRPRCSTSRTGASPTIGDVPTGLPDVWRSPDMPARPLARRARRGSRHQRRRLHRQHPHRPRLRGPGRRPHRRQPGAAALCPAPTPRPGVVGRLPGVVVGQPHRARPTPPAVAAS